MLRFLLPNIFFQMMAAISLSGLSLAYQETTGQKLKLWSEVIGRTDS